MSVRSPCRELLTWLRLHLQHLGMRPILDALHEPALAEHAATVIGVAAANNVKFQTDLLGEEPHIFDTLIKVRDCSPPVVCCSVPFLAFRMYPARHQQKYASGRSLHVMQTW